MAKKYKTKKIARARLIKEKRMNTDKMCEVWSTDKIKLR